MVKNNTADFMSKYLEFEAFVKGFMASKVEYVEKYRKKQIAKIRIIEVAIPLIIVLSVIFIMLPFMFNWDGIAYIISYFFCIPFILTLRFGIPFIGGYRNKKLNEYKVFYKKYLKIDEILNFIGVRPITRFSKEAKDHFQTLTNNCFTVGSMIETSFAITNDDVEFTVLETVDLRLDSDGESRHYLSVKFDFSKDIGSDVFINHSAGLPKVLPFESESFNQKFQIFSADEVEARYLITPTFMENLVKLVQTYKFDVFEAGFVKENNSFIFCGQLNNYSDIFEVSDINKPVNDLSIYNKFYFEINSLKRLAKYFELDKNTRI